MKNNQKLTLVSNFRLKAVGDDSGDIIIEGLANTPTEDRAGDVVLEEAWTKGGLNNYLKNPILLAYHDHSQPVGTVTDYSVNNLGLSITGRISTAAGDVYNLVKEEVLKALSVSFRVIDAEYMPEIDQFVIKDLELLEISVVSVGMNADSLFSVKKSLNQEEYTEFKNSYTKVEEKSTNNVETNSTPKGDTNVPDNIKKEAAKALTQEEVTAITTKAVADALASQKAIEVAEAKVLADAKKATDIAVEAGRTGAEALMAEVEKRFDERYEASQLEVSKTIEGLQADLKEKSSEILAMQTSKMTFGNNKGAVPGQPTREEAITAVLVAKATGKEIDKTGYFEGLKEKAGAHLTLPAKDIYETIYSTNMYDEIQDRLVIEPMYTNRIAMTSRSMVFPFNPEAGYANWVLESDQASKTLASSGTESTHAVNAEITLKANKMASKEQIGYEEDEDSLIPIAPLVAAAIIRRMARTSDVELLRGDKTVETIAGVTEPSALNGFATLATDQGTQFTQGGSYGADNPVTAADLQQVRRQMGRWGHMPSDVTYVVNQDVYFDLLEDPDFRTMDLVGTNATILTGQVGQINGSPVVVSDSFAIPAASTVAAIAVNTMNYLLGELRGITTERDRLILNQTNWIVTTRRFDTTVIDPNAKTCSALITAAA